MKEKKEKQIVIRLLAKFGCKLNKEFGRHENELHVFDDE